MGLADRIVERSPLALAQIGIEGIVFRQIQVRHIAKERSDRSLTVAVDQQNPVAATGQVLVFLDDDCVPTPGWLAEHARGHRQPGLVTTGRIAWHPTVRQTPLVRFAGERALFNFDLVTVPDDAPFATFYTANAASSSIAAFA